MTKIKKQRYVCVYHDGVVSISKDKLTLDEVNEMFDDNKDYDIAGMFTEHEAERLAQGIIKLIYKKSDKLADAGYKLPVLKD